MSEEDISEKAEILWGRYVAEVKYKGDTFKTIIVANVVPVRDFFRTLKGLFMHAKVALLKKKNEPILLSETEPKIIMFTFTNPSISMANKENRFIYYDKGDFVAFSDVKEKVFKKVVNKEMLEKEITDVYKLAPPRGEFIIDLNNKKIVKKKFLNEKEESKDEGVGKISKENCEKRIRK